MLSCDECGVRVSSSGYLGGRIICGECSRLKYVEEDEEALQERKDRYGGGE